MSQSRSRISISERFQEITDFLTNLENPYREGLEEGGYEDVPTLEEIHDRAAQLNTRDSVVEELIDGLHEDLGWGSFNEHVVRQHIIDRYDRELADQIERSGPGSLHFRPRDPSYIDDIANEVESDLRSGGARFGPDGPAPCFPAGMQISLAGGNVSSIEEIEVGYLVEAFPEFSSKVDRSSGPVNAKLIQGKVVRTFNNITEDWVEVHFADPATGEAKALTATPGHVMLTPEGGYKQLIEMIEAGAEEPGLSGDCTDAHSLGNYAGYVPLVLSDSQIVTA